MIGEFVARKVPARHKQSIGQMMVYHADFLLYEVQASHRTWVMTEADLEVRNRHLTEAKGHADHLESLAHAWFNIAVKESVATLLKRLDDESRPHGKQLHNLPKPASRKIKDENLFVKIIETIDNERAAIAGMAEYNRKQWRHKTAKL